MSLVECTKSLEVPLYIFSSLCRGTFTTFPLALVGPLTYFLAKSPLLLLLPAWCVKKSRYVSMEPQNKKKLYINHDFLILTFVKKVSSVLISCISVREEKI